MNKISIKRHWKRSCDANCPAARDEALQTSRTLSRAELVGQKKKPKLLRYSLRPCETVRSISQSLAVVQCEILSLSITFISPSENESGTAGVRCAGGAATVTGVPDATAWCVDNICTCG